MSENREAYQAAMREAHALAWALKWEAASLKYRESLDEFPNDPTARLSLAVALSKTGHLTEAIDEYEKVRLLLPRDPLVVTRIAELYLRLSLNEKAIQAYLDAAKLHLELDERPKAQNAWRLALEHSQSNRRSLLALRQALTSASEKSLLPDVEEALDQAIDVAPTPAIGTGKPSTSIEPGGSESEVEPGSKVDKTEPEASIKSIATIKTIINAPDSSLRHSDPASLLAFADAHASKGEAALALCEYLQASERLGNTAARGAARRAAQSLGQDWLVGDLDDLLAVPSEIRFDLTDALRQSYLHLKDNKHESALDEAWRAVSLSPGFLPAHLRLSQAQYAMGDRDASRERLAMVADLYRLAGDAERSIAVLRQQVSLEPDEPKTRQTLITGLISVGENEQAASELDSWAKHLREGGDIYGSLAHEREAIKLAPRPDRYLRLGLELEALGEVGEALGAYNKARALAPAEEVIAAGEARCQGILGLWDEMEENLAYVTEQISTDSILAESILADALRSSGRYGELAPFRYWLGTVLRAHGQSDPATEQLTLAAGDESRAGKLARFALGEIFQA